MKHAIHFSSALCLIGLFACGPAREPISISVSSQDIDNYWAAYDRIIATDDTLEKREYLQTLYLDRASPGLEKLREVRGYTAEEYLANIEAYPRFWASVRENTQRVPALAKQIEAGVADITDLYGNPKPASIYFAIGAFRTSGTAVDSFVLIGSEYALGDDRTVTEEFPDAVRQYREDYFATNPIDKVAGLIVHEFVHTQQAPIAENLLGRCLYEGVAEFVSCTATGGAPDRAVTFGLENTDTVRAVFISEMFADHNQSKWLWSNADNVFGQRDLGYFIGYTISQRYYEKASDKKKAIRKLIEIDYTDTSAVNAIIDASGFFPEPISALRASYRAHQPSVTELTQQGNLFTVRFSEPMDVRFRNFQFGPGGEETVIRFDSIYGFQEDGMGFRFSAANLAPEVTREIVLGPGFRDAGGAALRPYLVVAE